MRKTYVYEKHFTTEQLVNMKASTSSELRKKEEKVLDATMPFLTVCFFELVIIISALFWINKFTLFLTVVGMLVVGLVLFGYSTLYKDYKKFLNQVKEELKESHQ